MLTEEQIQNLKPGDPIVIHTTFSRVDSYGDIWFNAPSENDSRYEYFISPDYISLPSEHGTSVPTPEHDPCRLFKKGDIVRLKEWNGRLPIPPENWDFENGLFKVHVDENLSSFVGITREYSKDIYLASICFLELVTPVEELEPFGVRYSTDRDCAEVYHRRYKNTVAAFYCKCGITREQAEEHAEAERDRLNAEWRKEHAHD